MLANDVPSAISGCKHDQFVQSSEAYHQYADSDKEGDKGVAVAGTRSDRRGCGRRSEKYADGQRVR